MDDTTEEMKEEMEEETKEEMESLETRIAFQDDLIQKLDDALADQQQQLMTMADQIRVLTAHLKKVGLSSGKETDDPPPHY